jgi:hypothetical protein
MNSRPACATWQDTASRSQIKKSLSFKDCKSSLRGMMIWQLSAMWALNSWLKKKVKVYHWDNLGEYKYEYKLYTSSFPLFLIELGFELRASNKLHYLSHNSSPFCSGYFGDGGVSWTICPGWPETMILTPPPISGMSHQYPADYTFLKIFLKDRFRFSRSRVGTTDYISQELPWRANTNPQTVLFVFVFVFWDRTLNSQWSCLSLLNAGLQKGFTTSSSQTTL